MMKDSSVPIANSSKYHHSRRRHSNPSSKAEEEDPHVYKETIDTLGSRSRRHNHHARRLSDSKANNNNTTSILRPPSLHHGQRAATTGSIPTGKHSRSSSISSGSSSGSSKSGSTGSNGKNRNRLSSTGSYSNGGKYSNYSSVGNSTLTSSSYFQPHNRKRTYQRQDSSQSSMNSLAGETRDNHDEADYEDPTITSTSGDGAGGSSTMSDRRRNQQQQHHRQHRSSVSQDSRVSWDASTFDTYSRASTRRTLDSRGSRGSTTSRSVSFHPSVVGSSTDHQHHRRRHYRDNFDPLETNTQATPLRLHNHHDPTPPPFWIWLAIVLSSILWFLASQGKVRGELHYSLYAGQTWQLPTPKLLANKYFIEAPKLDDYNQHGVEIYQMRWCPPNNGPTLTIQRNSTVSLGSHRGGNSDFTYDYFRLNAGSVLELKATQLEGSSAIYLVRGANVLDYLLKTGQYPFEYDNMRSLYLDATDTTSPNTVSTSIPIRRSDAFMLFYSINSNNDSNNGPSNSVSQLEVQVTLHGATHLLPDEAKPVCSAQDTSTGNCNWFSKQEMAGLKVSCIIAKVVETAPMDNAGSKNFQIAPTTTTTTNDTMTTTTTTTTTTTANDTATTPTTTTSPPNSVSDDATEMMLEFRSTSLATTDRKVFVTVAGTLTILIAVFLCCRSLHRKSESSSPILLDGAFDAESSPTKMAMSITPKKSNVRPNDNHDEEAAPLL